MGGKKDKRDRLHLTNAQQDRLWKYIFRSCLFIVVVGVLFLANYALSKSSRVFNKANNMLDTYQEEVEYADMGKALELEEIE